MKSSLNNCWIQVIKKPGYFYVKERSISEEGIALKSKMERWNIFIFQLSIQFLYSRKNASILFYDNEVAGIRAPVAVKKQYFEGINVTTHIGRSRCITSIP